VVGGRLRAESNPARERTCPCFGATYRMRQSPLRGSQVLPGTYAEAVVCAAERVVPHPSGLSVLEAAALLQPCNSAWIAVMKTARIEAGMRVLVHGGAGAVGSQMIRLSRCLGAAVSTTCRADNRDPAYHGASANLSRR
jgi:NADPH:quinone reductase-like Zn-dependent oxidoreductase